MDTESAERSVESTQRSEDNQSVRIKQYSKKGGTVFGVFGQQAGSNPAEGSVGQQPNSIPDLGDGDGDTTLTLSPNSSGISSSGSSQYGSPARGTTVGSNPARGRRRRARSEPRRPRRDKEKESSPGSDYGSLLSDTETWDSVIHKPGDSAPLKPGDSSFNKSGDSTLHTTCESQRLSVKDLSILQNRESPHEETARQQRRQRQRSASESVSDKLSDTQTQRDKDLEDLWPESNSLDRNTSQYGNNAVAVRGAKLQQSDAFQRGCQINAATGITGASRNDEFRIADNNAAAKTGARLIDSNRFKDKTAVETTGGKSQLSGCNRCQSCEKERQASPPPVPPPPRVPLPFHSEHSPHNANIQAPATAAQCKPKQPSPTSATTTLLPKSRSFILPRSQRPSFTAPHPSTTSRLQPCRESCGRTDNPGPERRSRSLQQYHGAGNPPEDYLQHHYHRLTKSQPTNPRDTETVVGSHEPLLLTGLTKSHNQCNNNSSNKSEDYDTIRCHGDDTGTGSVAGLWWTSGAGGAGCHGSSCCLNVVQDVLSRIPVVAPPSRLSSVLDLRTCNTPPPQALLPAEYPLCSPRYVSTSARPPAPHYATMRIKRSATSLMGNLPCLKQRHHHDDNDVKTKHVSYV